MTDSLFAFEKISYIEIDFTNAFCKIGICRPVNIVYSDWIQRLARPPGEVDLIGLSNNDERGALTVSALSEAIEDSAQEYFFTRYGLGFSEPTDTTKWDAFKRNPEAESGPSSPQGPSETV